MLDSGFKGKSLIVISVRDYFLLSWNAQRKYSAEILSGNAQRECSAGMLNGNAQRDLQSRWKEHRI